MKGPVEGLVTILSLSAEHARVTLFLIMLSNYSFVVICVNNGRKNTDGKLALDQRTQNGVGGEQQDIFMV